MSSPQRPTATSAVAGVGTDADAAPRRDERAVPPPVTPPGRRARAVVGALAVALGAVVLAGCGEGGTSSSVTCSDGQCRATVTGAPADVEQPGTSTTTAVKKVSNGKTTTSTVKNRRDGVDFTVAGQGAGWADIDEDGVVTRVPVGGTFADDGATIRLESADGRTAVFTFPRRG